jgi:DNA-binding NtrC family response regulator
LTYLSLWLYFNGLRQIVEKGEKTMGSMILENKTILVVDDEPDVLTIVEEEICEACPTCRLDKATDYETAASFLQTREYDTVILDIMGVRGFDLLEIAVRRKFRVAMLTAHALSAETLEKAHRLGARTYLPKGKLGQLVPFLEDLFIYDSQTGWKRLLDKLGDLFDRQFESGWRSKYDIKNWY